MGVLHRLTAQDRKKMGLKYKALAYGFIPVWMSDPETWAVPVVATRNWVPEWPLDLMGHLYSVFLDIADPYGLSEATTLFVITGEIND